MSYAVDVNLLLYASDQTSPRHQASRQFIGRCAAGPELWCLAWPTVMAYLRIATHPAIFGAPLAPGEALANISSLLALPHVRPVAELDDFLAAYRHVAGDLPVRGNLVPDAHLAAILFQHGVARLYTLDRDFLKFATLDVRDPLA